MVGSSVVVDVWLDDMLLGIIKVLDSLVLLLDRVVLVLDSVTIVVGVKFAG